MLGLLTLAVLLHRIQNIVVPPRSSGRAHTHNRPQRFYQRWYGSFLPLDLTRTSTRLAFHLPTLYFLCRSLVVWFVILMQTWDVFPASDSGYIWTLGQWTQHLEMQNVCWMTFCAICAAFTMEAFVRGLDGGSLAVVPMNTNNTSPFSLIGYSFLLHIYSSPITHVYKPVGLPSRPDKHVIVTITIPLLQFTIFHMLAIRKRWSNHRLLPTALSSILSLLHFHSTLYSHYRARPATPSPLEPKQPPKMALPLSSKSTLGRLFPAPTPPPIGLPPPTAPTGPLYSSSVTTFPLLNYVPNTFETLLLLTIALTVVLNALTQLILTGHVSRPLLGLGLSGSGANGGWVWAPPYDEDWGVVLLRVGTASLEATGLRGWGNEMPGVTAAPPVSTSLLRGEFPEYGTARLGPSGVVHVSNGFGGAGEGRRYRRRGLANEVRDVDIGASANARAFGVDLVNLRWIKEAWKFLTVAWAVGRGLIRGVWRYVISGGKSWRARQAAVAEMEIVDEEEEVHDEGALYSRFLRQEEISDDDEAGQAWDFAEHSESEGEQASDEEFDPADAVGVYADLGETAATPVLLAHMAHDSDSPLTRRQYRSLVSAGPQVPPMPPWPVSRPSEAVDDTRRNCVICTTDAREIICWPCRCLSMCDGCREVLASRSSASKHRCPCCRQAVEGYSRIFIP